MKLYLVLNFILFFTLIPLVWKLILADFLFQGKLLLLKHFLTQKLFLLKYYVIKKNNHSFKKFHLNF